MRRIITLSAFVLLAVMASGQEPRLSHRNATGLFDGETLEGWVTTGGRYDGHARWWVDDEQIVGGQGPGRKGGLLYTAQRYRNFIFSCEVKIDWPFDSGIFVRMQPEGRGAQVTIDWREGGEIGAIYSDEFLLHNLEAGKSFRKDDWNRFTVRCVGPSMHLTVWMNGEEISDYVVPPEKEGFVADGLIGLQVHPGEASGEDEQVRFRNLFIRELPDFDPALFACDDHGQLTPTEAARIAGWRPLFDGRSLAGWEPSTQDARGYAVQDGVLVFPSQGPAGELRTERDYRDFELTVEFKTAYMCNSGLFLRASRDGKNAAYSGCEIQILDDFNWEEVSGDTLRPDQFTGGLYGALPNPHRDALRPLGRWNRYDVLYQGSRLRVKLNGIVLYDIDTHELETAKPPFARRAPSGFIGLQRHAPDQVEEGAYAWFRNLFIREIP
ncbi:MAG: DUF1080 domain-containing protein [Planctomycetes bacterium]|nr:DUF1080 domain-containing protein [Planctomycetota bacterium]